MAGREYRYFCNFFSKNELDSAGDIETGSAEYHTVLNSINGYLRRSYIALTDIITRLDNIYSNQEGYSVLLSDIKSSISDIKIYVNDIKVNFNNLSNKLTPLLDKYYNLLFGINGSLNDLLSNYYIPEWQGDLMYGWENFWSTFLDGSFSDVLKNTLLEVQKEIDNQVNPLSDDNKESYTAAVDNLKKTTFVGSAYDVVETFPKKLNEALNADSRSVLQFTTAGTKNSYFSLPARTYSIDFSWYKPFKPTADVVISAFIYLGFAIAFFKRLPEIIQGAGVATVGFSDFYETRFGDSPDNDMANSYYNYLVSNGGIDDFDNFDQWQDSKGNRHNF